LPIHVEEADLTAYRIAETYDTVIAVGLLMFLPRTRATALLEEIKAHVNPGGAAVVNVLTEGTTYLEMFEPGHFTLFGEDEIEAGFAGWRIPVSRSHRFDAPGSTVKRFATVVAQKP
jgi:tellurite methyltransferase